jgi:hypothetical protein
MKAPKSVRLLQLLLVAQIALAGLGVWAWRSAGASGPEPLTEPPPGPATDAQLPATVESAYPAALARAQAWRDDARLLHVSAELMWPREAQSSAVSQLPDGGWLLFVFVAPWDRFGGNEDAATLTLLVDRRSGSIYGETALGWEEAPALPAPLVATYPVSSTVAVVIAEAHGGATFRRACPDVRWDSRIGLDVTSDGKPIWTVTYRDDRVADKNSLTVRIDASTGAVIDLRDTSLACP